MNDIEQISSSRPIQGQGVIGVGLSTSDSAPTLSAPGACLDQFEALDIDSVEVHLPNMEVVLGRQVNATRLLELRRIVTDRPFAITLHGAVSSDLYKRYETEWPAAIAWTRNWIAQGREGRAAA